MTVEGVDFQGGVTAWDYHVDLQASVRVTTELSAAEYVLGRSQERDIHLLIEARCNTTFWRTQEGVVLQPFDGDSTRLFAMASVRIPGNAIEERIEISARIVGSAQTLMGGQGPRMSVLSEGPTQTSRLTGELGTLPVYPVGFSSVGWLAAPWRVQVDASDGTAPYSRCVRVYINTDLKAGNDLLEARSDEQTTVLASALRRDFLETLIVECNRQETFSSMNSALNNLDEDMFIVAADAIIQTSLGIDLESATRLAERDWADFSERIAHAAGYFAVPRSHQRG